MSVLTLPQLQIALVVVWPGAGNLAAIALIRRRGRKEIGPRRADLLRFPNTLRAPVAAIQVAALLPPPVEAHPVGLADARAVAAGADVSKNWL